MHLLSKNYVTRNRYPDLRNHYLELNRNLINWMKLQKLDKPDY